MKKLFLMMGLASLFMVACNNAPKQQPQEAPAQDTVVAEEHHCPFCPLKAEYAKWEELEETAKADLNQKAFDLFAEMDAEMEAKKAEMEAEGHKCMHEMAEMTEEAKAECEAKCAEMKAKCEEMQAAWANFANLSLDEQKDLVLERIAFVKGQQCHHEGEGEEHHCCGKHEGEEGHQCQHGEGHQCQHGEGHQCQHAAE